MNNQKKKIIAAAGVTAMVVAGCGKYEDGPGFSLMSKKSRMVGTWDLVSATSPSTGEVYNYCQNGAECAEITMNKDNTMTFKVSYQGSSQSYSYAGTWDFNEDKSQLNWTDEGGAVTSFEIKRLTNKELWLDDDITSVDGDILKLEAK
jgi:hypothetical protein